MEPCARCHQGADPAAGLRGSHEMRLISGRDSGQDNLKTALARSRSDEVGCSARPACAEAESGGGGVGANGP